MPLYAVIEAPSNLGLKPTGVEGLAAALLDLGLDGRIGADRRGRVPAPPYDPARDPDTGLLNGPGIRAYARALSDAVGASLDAGRFPVVLGGDCSVLLGGLLALRRRRPQQGRYGLLFLDGHADFYTPAAEPNGEVASMELALATGRGPALLADLEGLGPLVQAEDVAALGVRDADEAREHGSPDLAQTAALVADLAHVRRVGIGAAVGAALDRLRANRVAGAWLHLDADVLDDAVMPAVDYRQPSGLSPDELADALRLAVRSGLLAGMTVTIYNPALDTPDRAAGRVLADVLAAGLA